MHSTKRPTRATDIRDEAKDWLHFLPSLRPSHLNCGTLLGRPPMTLAQSIAFAYCRFPSQMTTVSAGTLIPSRWLEIALTHG
eukprot:1136642-Amphidinium_carterae.2